MKANPNLTQVIKHRCEELKFKDDREHLMTQDLSRDIHHKKGLNEQIFEFQDPQPKTQHMKGLR